MPTPLLLAYDPACLRCCRLALGLARRDQRGLLLILSVRDPDLLAMAPELAGKLLEKEIHGLDLGTREVRAGPTCCAPSPAVSQPGGGCLFCSAFPESPCWPT